jgi:hypothetical protein
MATEEKKSESEHRVKQSSDTVLIRTHVDPETGRKLAEIKRHVHAGTVGEAISFLVRQYGDVVLSSEAGDESPLAPPDDGVQQAFRAEHEGVMTEDDIRALCGFDE